MRRGASMPELLVAMLVLLVGIWVVAAKFPKLSEIMTSERVRDKMTRKAEQEVEQARSNAAGIPQLIAPSDPTKVSATNPYGLDDTISAFFDPKVRIDHADATRPLNSVENTLVVVGETFHLPAPPLPSPSVLHFLSVGPAAPAPGQTLSQALTVYQPIPLTRDDTIDPTARDETGPPLYWVTPGPGSFTMRDDGTIRFALPQRDPDGNPFTPNIPSNQAQLEVSYDWLDSDNNVHRMAGELVDCTPDTGQTTWTSSPVAALTVPTPAGQVVPNSATATFRYRYEVVLSTGTRTTTAPAAYIDANYGEALSFDQSEQGKTLCVDYRLRTYLNPNDATDPDNGRRIPLMREVHRVPEDAVAGVSEVPLDLQQIDDQVAVFPTDLSGTALASPPHVIAFDVETGRAYSDTSSGAGLLNVSYAAGGSTPATATTVPGSMEGRVSFANTSPALGRTLLFYYRNVDGQTVQLNRAPATFVEDIWTTKTPPATLPAWALGRWFRPERGGAYDATAPTLVLPNSCLTQTVQVDYLCQGRRQVEIHTLGEQSPATLTLDAGPDAIVQIISVRGVSLKGFCTWMSRGRLRTVSVETLLSAQLDATLAKEPHQGAMQP